MEGLMGSAAQTAAPPPSHRASRGGPEPTGGAVGGRNTGALHTLHTLPGHPDPPQAGAGKPLVWVEPFGEPGRVRQVSVPGCSPDYTVGPLPPSRGLEDRGQPGSGLEPRAGVGPAGAAPRVFCARRSARAQEKRAVLPRPAEGARAGPADPAFPRGRCSPAPGRTDPPGGHGNEAPLLQVALGAPLSCRNSEARAPRGGFAAPRPAPGQGARTPSLRCRGAPGRPAGGTPERAVCPCGPAGLLTAAGAGPAAGGQRASRGPPPPPAGAF